MGWWSRSGGAEGRRGGAVRAQIPVRRSFFVARRHFPTRAPMPHATHCERARGVLGNGKAARIHAANVNRQPWERLGDIEDVLIWGANPEPLCDPNCALPCVKVEGRGVRGPRRGGATHD